MAKRYDEPIEVATEDGAPNGSGWGDANPPLEFSWRGRRYYVEERLSSWREAGQWWEPRNDGKSAAGSAGAHYEREYFRVIAHKAGATTGDLDADGFLITSSSVYDIYRDRTNGIWRMGRVWD